MSPSRAAARDLMNGLIAPTLEAGALEMRYYRSGVAVEAKADKSPVTVADREAEAILIAALRRLAPDVPIVAEESWSPGETLAPGGRFFLVDPLDGTREFIEQRGEFTVNVALVVDGRPTLGIIYAPALGELVLTADGETVLEANVAPDSGAASIADLTTRRIRTRTPERGALTAVASRSHGNAETEAVLARYPIAERRNAGSSLKFCLIARGAADIYPRLGPTREWDIAAGHAILAAAGGTVTMIDGAPLAYGKVEAGFLNPHFLALGKADIRPT